MIQEVVVVMLVTVLGLVSCGPSAEQRVQEHLAKGKALLAEGKYEAAAGELQKAVELNRDSLDAHLYLGDAYRGLKQYPKALESYRAAMQVNRYVVAPHLHSARAKIEMGNVDDGIEELIHVIELDAKNVEAMIELGRAYQILRPQAGGRPGVPVQNYKRAEFQLTQALTLAPDNVVAHYELAKTYEGMGERSKAVAQWTKVQELAGRAAGSEAMAADARTALSRLAR